MIDREQATEEILDVIANLYGVPEDEAELTDLRWQIRMAIDAAEIAADEREVKKPQKKRMVRK